MARKSTSLNESEHFAFSHSQCLPRLPNTGERLDSTFAVDKLEVRVTLTGERDNYVMEGESLPVRDVATQQGTHMLTVNGVQLAERLYSAEWVGNTLAPQNVGAVRNPALSVESHVSDVVFRGLWSDEPAANSAASRHEHAVDIAKVESVLSTECAQISHFNDLACISPLQSPLLLVMPRNSARIHFRRSGSTGEATGPDVEAGLAIHLQPFGISLLKFVESISIRDGVLKDHNVEGVNAKAADSIRELPVPRTSPPVSAFVTLIERRHGLADIGHSTFAMDESVDDPLQGKPLLPRRIDNRLTHRRPTPPVRVAAPQLL